jgi:glycosyltransferase involved in cell wall biosynthesis
MKIVYVLTSLGVGGAERQVVALAERMAARGHAVSLLVLRPQLSEEWPTTVDCLYLDMRKTPVSLIVGLARGHRFLRGFNPEIVHSHVFPANMAARLLRLCGATPPLISTVHNVYEGSSLRMWAYRLTDPLCRWTTAVSQAAADRYMRLKAVPAHKCSVLTNGIDTTEFAPNIERRVHMREELGAGDAFMWLTAGRLVAAKDYPNLLHAFAQVRAVAPEVQLWIAGEAAGPDSVTVQGLAAELKLEGSVLWLGLRRDMPALLDAADGFVLGSAWEGMPLVVGEAMAMEKPVVATDVGGVRELVGDAGTIVPHKKPDVLAQAMLDTMHNTPEARRSLGRSARERIESQFSMGAKADEWETLYQHVLENNQ